MILGSEVARLISEFESLHLPELDPELNYRQHEEELSTHESFEKHTTGLVQVIKDYGKPLIDACPKVLILNTRDCPDDVVDSSDTREISIISSLVITFNAIGIILVVMPNLLLNFLSLTLN